MGLSFIHNVWKKPVLAPLFSYIVKFFIVFSYPSHVEITPLEQIKLLFLLLWHRRRTLQWNKNSVQGGFFTTYNYVIILTPAIRCIDELFPLNAINCKAGIHSFSVVHWEAMFSWDWILSHWLNGKGNGVLKIAVCGRMET